MVDFRADLHCHSSFSDGSATPTELIKLAKEIGLSGLSITDHDSIEAYAEAIPCAKEKGIEMISGAEFSAVHRGVSVHILGYAFNLNNPIIHNFCQKHHERRETRNRAILDLLKKHHMPVTEEEMKQVSQLDQADNHRTIGRPHIAQAMIKKGYVTTVNEAFKKYLGEKRCCYAPGASFTVEQTLSLLHDAKALAIIAHPHLIEEQKIIPDLLSMNFDGLEGFYAKFTPNNLERFVKVAKKKEWIITGGSDFHGSVKPAIPLGCSWVNEATFHILQTHYLANATS